MRQVDAVVIGAGQAGLATSYHLASRGIEHVVLERGRVAETWRSHRWDSFALNSPNWAFDLPGQPYTGPDPDGFMLRDEIVSSFEDYARTIRAPVEHQVEVTRLSREPVSGRYRLETSDGEITCRAVVVATGAYQRSNRPAARLDERIYQLHTDEYRSPAELPHGEAFGGGVLVVGSGQSGCQIAEDLIEAGRSVWLATGSCPWIPRRYRGRDNVRWRMDMRTFDQTVEELGHATRLAAPPIQTGVAGGRDLHLGTLHRIGVTLTGRLASADGYTVRFDNDLPAHVARGDEVAARFRADVDRFIEDQGLDWPAEEPFEPAADLPDGPTELDLRRAGISSVIWASGYRLDFSWIDLDLRLRDGYPDQTQGVSTHAGLYFMGLQLMHTRKSGLIFGVGEDAEHVASAAAAYLRIDSSTKAATGSFSTSS